MIGTVLWVCILVGVPCQTPEQEVSYLKQSVRRLAAEVVVPHSHQSVRQDGVYRGMGNGTTDVERWRSLVAAWFGEKTETALCLLRAESGGNPNALNQQGSSARGLMQVLASLWAPILGISYGDLYDPAVNMSAARYAYDRQGWGAWSPWLRGECRG